MSSSQALIVASGVNRSVVGLRRDLLCYLHGHLGYRREVPSVARQERPTPGTDCQALVLDPQLGSRECRRELGHGGFALGLAPNGPSLKLRICGNGSVKVAASCERVGLNERVGDGPAGR